MNADQFNSLPEPQRKAAQQRLIDLGYYTGKADGKFGAGTKAAFDQEAKQKADSEATATAKEEKARTDKIASDKVAVDLANAQTAGKAVDTQAEGAKAERDRKAAKDAEAKSAYGIGLTTGSSVVAPLAGYVGGRAVGSGLNRLADNSQRSKNAVLQATADDRTSGLTTRDGARIGASRSGAMPSENALLRVGGRMLPHAITGFGMMGKGGVALSQVDPEAPIEDQAIKRATGLGFIGAGVGTLEQGANYAINPGVAPDARSIAIMESNQLRRNNQAADAQAAPRQHLPGSGGDMMAQARRYNIPGRSKMSVEELRTAVGKAVAETAAPRGGAASKMLKGLAGPIAAGAAAYAMTPDRAQAADGSDAGGNQAEALTNAGITSGLYAGGNKLLGMLPKGIGTAAGAGMNALGAGMAAYDNASDAQGYRAAMPPEMQNSPVGQFLPHAMPLAMRGASDIASIASAPGRIRDAAVSAMTPGNAQQQEYQQALYPEAVPPDTSQQAPQDFDSQLSELSALLSQAGQSPVQTAAASQQVAQAPVSFPNAVPNRLLGK